MLLTLNDPVSIVQAAKFRNTQLFPAGVTVLQNSLEFGSLMVNTEIDSMSLEKTQPNKSTCSQDFHHSKLRG